jgi:hypothetical protein
MAIVRLSISEWCRKRNSASSGQRFFAVVGLQGGNHLGSRRRRAEFTSLDPPRAPMRPPIHRPPCLDASVGWLRVRGLPARDFFATFFSDKDNSCYRRSSTYPHREPTMVKRCKNPSAAKRPPPARWEPVRHTPRRATRDRRPSILERPTTRLTVAHIASRAEGLSAPTDPSDHRPDAGDRPARRLLLPFADSLGSAKR